MEISCFGFWFANRMWKDCESNDPEYQKIRDRLLYQNRNYIQLETRRFQYLISIGKTKKKKKKSQQSIVVLANLQQTSRFSIHRFSPILRHSSGSRKSPLNSNEPRITARREISKGQEQREIRRTNEPSRSRFPLHKWISLPNENGSRGCNTLTRSFVRETSSPASAIRRVRGAR